MRKTKVLHSAACRRTKSAAFFCLMLCLAMFTACAGPQLFLPAIAPSQTGVHHDGRFVWHDLLTNDVPSTKRFYGELFNWEFEGKTSDDSAYATIKKNDIPIGSVLYLKRNGSITQTKVMASE